MAKLRSVELRYDDGSQIWIDSEHIEQMVKASEALEMIERARQVAKRLSQIDIQ